MFDFRPKPRIALASSIGIALLHSAFAYGQSAIALNREIPHMRIRVCPTLADAQKEAALALQLAQEPYRAGTLGSLRNPTCESVLASVAPLKEETSIVPFTAWTLAYDEESPSAIPAPDLGHDTKIKVSLQKDEVRFYFGNFKTRDGSLFSGWIEVPRRPYILSYLADQRKKASSK